MKSKSIQVTLCLLIAATGCHPQNRLPKQSQDRLEYGERLQAEQERGTNPNLAAAEDETGDTIIGATMGAALLVVTIPFGFIADEIKLARGDTPAKAAREMNDAASIPDIRREGIANLVTRWNFTRRPPYTTRYRQLAEQDPNDTVRAMAIRALNVSRDQSATPVFIAALEDDSELVRLEAVKALNNIPDTNAVPALIRRLQGKREEIHNGQPDTVDESIDVRVAAAEALRRYRTLDVARVLVSQLSEKDFSVAWQSNHSLISLTKRDFGYNQSAWLQYLTGPDKPFG